MLAYVRYGPGSFSKNFAWHGTGLRKLHTAIRRGFHASLSTVERQRWRADSEIGDTALELIPVNFFLHNAGGSISVDELVRQGVERPHTLQFDRLALFALHLNRVGKPPGAAIERPAMWANEFVRERLWNGGAWRAEALRDPSLDAFIDDRMRARPDVRVKCRNNYRHLFELCKYWPAPLGRINSGAEQWIGSAFFLAWDRFILGGGSADPAALIRLANDEELYKLLGVSQEYANDHIESLMKLYSDVGNVSRFSQPVHMPERLEVPEELETSWIDQQESDEVVERRTIQIQAQIRDRRKAAALKIHYDNRCMICDVQLQIGDNLFHSQAAHIKPLGRPHDGPDRASNMIVLCPNHHLQFDRGILRFRKVGEDFEVLSKVRGDPVQGKKIKLSHQIDDRYVTWHRNWFRSTRG